MCETHNYCGNFIFSIEEDPISIWNDERGYDIVDVEYLGECYWGEVPYEKIFPHKMTECCEIIDPDCIAKLDDKVVIKRKSKDCIELDFLEFGKMCVEKYRKHPGTGKKSRKRISYLMEKNARLIDELDELKKKHQKCDGPDFSGK